MRIVAFTGRGARARIVICAALFLVAFAALAIWVRSGSRSAPDSFETVARQPEIYPDYRDTVVPANIAPLNFDLCEKDADKVRIVVSGADASGNIESEIAVFSDSKIRFSQRFWKETTRRFSGKKLAFSTYIESDGRWSKLDDWTIGISADPIDPWVSYRKIAPGYEYFSDVALWNRNLETFEERAFFRARLASERTCVNCHSYQNYRTDAFLFHMRFNKAGTVFGVNGDLVKRDLKAEGMDSGCSYCAWRPNSLHVAFASASTFQTFHTVSPDRIDVLDGFSDLYLYDVERNELKSIVPPGDEFLDTYPSWSADGSSLYYCSAKNPGFSTERFVRNPSEQNPDRNRETLLIREKIKYDVKRVSYDEKTGKFGSPETVFAASELDKSALFPRLSPDGKTLLFTVTRYGCFPIWYLDSDIWALDTTTGEARSVDEINAPNASDSYHSWSSSGRWIVFSSRREDGSRTRLYFSHFDETGNFSKPFLLPQKDPIENFNNTRSHNVPEFTLEPVKIPERKILKEASKELTEYDKAKLR